jgi:hypothetical protein
VEPAAAADVTGGHENVAAVIPLSPRGLSRTPVQEFTALMPAFIIGWSACDDPAVRTPETLDQLHRQATELLAFCRRWSGHAPDQVLADAMQGRHSSPAGSSLSTHGRRVDEPAR